MRTGRWLGHLTLLGAAACTADEAPPVAIVAHLLPESAYHALPTLVLADVRFACIEEANDACAIGVSEAVVGPAGVVVFWGVDGKATQLYRLDTTRTVTRLGRIGDGPGEYRYAAAFGFDERGDVAIADLPQRRFTRFGASGEVLATQNLPYPIGLFHIEFAGGSAIAIATEVASEADSMAVHEYVLDVSRGDAVRRRTLAFKRPGYAVSDMRPVPPAFAAHDHFGHLADGTLLHSSGTAFQIDEYTLDGRSVRRFGFNMSGREVSGEELEATERRALARVGDARMRNAMQASMRAAGRAARHPAITRLVVLGSTGIAVRQAPRLDGDSVTWVLFGSPMQPSGRLVLGVDDRILGAFDDRILLSLEDRGPGGLHWARIDTVSQPRGP